MATISTECKVWFVTGASAGLGRAMVAHLLEKGDKVVATMRKPNDITDLVAKYPTDQLLVLKLDVISLSKIQATFAKAIEVFGRIDVVYNNAGYGILGEIEGMPEEAARRMFDVNFWGAVNVSREAIRVFRDVNKPIGGHLLQAYSFAGYRGVAGLGYYSASKHALEGISQALASEVHSSWNIKVTIVGLGGFKMRGVDLDTMLVPVHPAYTSADSTTKLIRDSLLSDDGVSGLKSDPNKATREMCKITLDDNVGLRVPLGLDALQIAREEAERILKDADIADKWSVDLL